MLFASSAGVRPPSRWLFAPVILGIAAFVTLLAAVGFLGIRYWHEQQSASHQVEHSRQVIEALERVQTSLNDLETERRGYLLTPQPTFVKPYGVSEDTVRAGVEALQALVADDPLQSLRASHLALIVDAKLRQMDEIIETARTSGLEAALAKLQGKDEIQSQIDQMLDIERFLIANWQPRVDALQQSTVWLIAAAVLLAFIFAGAAFGLAWLEETRRRKATEENTASTETSKNGRRRSSASSTPTSSGSCLRLLNPAGSSTPTMPFSTWWVSPAKISSQDGCRGRS
jgi:CHASE3 domain sensor protein